MLDIFYCIRDEHDITFVVLAALLCVLSALTASLLLRQAVRGTEERKTPWLLAAGACAGFGIWATHFVAMLGYTPGMIVGYAPALTLVSLAIPIVTTCTGFAIAASRMPRAALPLGAAITGGGFAAMHYCGMVALEIPAVMRWDAYYVTVSVALVMLALGPAFHLVLRRDGHWPIAGATALMALGVIALHFTGMAGLALVPSRIETTGQLISPRTMAIAVSMIALMLAGVSALGLAIARRNEARIAASQRQFSILVQGISDCAIYMLDHDGHVTNWNAGAQRLKGYTAAEVVGKPLSTFYRPEDRANGMHEKALEIAAREGKFTGEGWRVRKDGSQFWAHVMIEAVRDEQGARIGFAKITRDITRTKEDQDRIARISEQRDAALGNMHQGLVLFDNDARLVLANRRFMELYDLSEDDCRPGTPHRDIVRAAVSNGLKEPASEERVERACRLIRESLSDPKHTPILSEYSEDFVVSIVSRRLADGGWVSTFDDITNQRASEARIAHMALHDGLTSLPNRTRFNLWLDDALDRAAHTGRRVGVTVIDLDRFKDINDSFGHAWGDVVLKELANRLAAALEEGEIAARLGGDEFGVAMTYANDSELADFLARVESCFAEPLEHYGQPLVFGASLGVASYPTDGPNRETLLNNADLAMYRAKAQIGESICYYEPCMDESARARRQIANDLRQAIERNELTLLYQPQHMLRDGKLSGYEALLRWHHPGRGLISPVEFIPIAEETGMILRIGEWVMRHACAEAMKWPEGPRVAVNLSPVQLVQQDIAQLVTQVLLDTGLPARRLELEITESAIITDKARALHNLRQIKALGVAIAMDDFGTGYSSLDTLHSFPFDKIKIDKSFLLKSDKNEQAKAIIRAVLALGQSLRIPVLAEGVETQTQLELLLQEGCEEAQGYFLGRPAVAPSLVVANADSDRPAAQATNSYL